MPPRKRAPASRLHAATAADAKAAAARAAEAAKPKTLKVAVDASERELLVAMRARVAAEIDGGVPAHALAGLMRQLRELDREIRLIDAREAESGDVDDAAGSSEVDDDVERLDPSSVFQ